MRQTAFFRRALPALGCSLGLAALTQAQTPLYTFNGPAANDRLGAAVGAADVNNDGRPDILVGGPQDFNVFAAGKGYVRVFSGPTGALLNTFMGDATFDQFGFAVAGVGDVNNDGHEDFIVGAPSASPSLSLQGMARVISGQNGATLHTFLGAGANWSLGFSVASAGDVNGDGRPDLIVGAPFAPVNGNNAGTARVYSGLDGSLLHQFNGGSANRRRGYSVASAGDVNGDGRADLIVGSLFDGVRVFSGMTGAVLHTFTAPNADIFGKAVCSVPDLNGDSVRDIVIGATQEDVFSPGKGYVQVRSGATGALLFTAVGDAIGDRFGIRVSSVGDWNADGVPDIAVSAMPSDGTVPSYVRIISGVSGASLQTFMGATTEEGFGFSVAGVGDVNGNSKQGVAIGAPTASPSGIASGRAFVYEGLGAACGGTQNYCVTSPNSAGSGALITSTGSTSIATNNFTLLATGCPTNQNGIFYYGPNQINPPFGDGVRCVGGTVHRLPIVNTGGAGIAGFAINFNNLPDGGEILPFQTWNFQFWYRDPGFGSFGFNLSNGLNANFCP